MEWQQLEYFDAVAKLQHFTDAAERLAISQPALSRSIAKLERELGVPLFDRQGRNVALNRNGRLFHARTARILQEMAEAKREIAELRDPHYGTISLAFVKSLGIRFVPHLVRTYLDLYPHVNFQLSQHASSVMIEQLARGEIDFCLSYAADDVRDIEWSRLWTEDIYLFVHSSHPLARRRSVNVGDIVREKFIALKQGYGSRAIMDRLFASAGVQPTIAFEADEVVSVMGFIAANLGVALLPQVDGMNVEHIARLAIADYRCDRTIGLAWRKGNYMSAAARQFRAFVIEHREAFAPSGQTTRNNE